MDEIIHGLSEYERSYYDNTGFWETEKVEKRTFFKERNKIEKESTGSEYIQVRKLDNVCYVPRLEKILDHYMDIALLFSTKELVGNFLDYLFWYGLDDDINGGSAFFYHEKTGTYSIDYSYMIHVMLQWGVDNLHIDEEEFKRFLKQFTPSKDVNYLKPNYFLVAVIFGDIYEILSSTYDRPQVLKRKRVKQYIKYYNQTIVKTVNGEEFYYQGVPFKANSILKYCDREVIVRLFKERNKLDLSQLHFGRAATDYRVESHFFLINM